MRKFYESMIRPLVTPMKAARATWSARPVREAGQGPGSMKSQMVRAMASELKKA